ncbi:MAG: uracil phosphoribosyltransferase [Clostridia bacterium]|nr:uracil phosphoribosyltransferase [Clostridia bacterium]
MNNVTIFDHPLVMHKLAILRNKETTGKQFRELVEELTMLMTFEAFKDMPTIKVLVETPLESTYQYMVDNKSVAIIPILRAGLGMVNGVQALFPTSRVGFIGLYRDKVTLNPCEYYCKLPDNITSGISVILDPMLATGGSAVAAIDLLKCNGAKRIKLMNIIASPVGIEKVHSIHPDVQIYCASVDRQLNDDGYILPGLGDAGDRLYGTK